MLNANTDIQGSNSPSEAEVNEPVGQDLEEDKQANGKTPCAGETCRPALALVLLVRVVRKITNSYFALFFVFST